MRLREAELSAIKRSQLLTGLASTAGKPGGQEHSFSSRPGAQNTVVLLAPSLGPFHICLFPDLLCGVCVGGGGEAEGWR